MTGSTVDLNADLGESFGRWRLGDDDAMLAYVSSANVACGFHAGDPTVLRRTCARAVARGVAIGAQVGYRDLAGFGRRFVDVAPDDLINDVIYQMGALDAFAAIAGGRVAYLKPHGALYNAVVHHEAQARALAHAVHLYSPGMPVLGLPGSAWLREADRAGLRPVPEAFADRAYTAEGTLVPRTEPGAVLHDPALIAERCLRLVADGQVIAVDGTPLTVHAESVCLHGDTPDAVEMARAVRLTLTEAGVAVAPFAGARA
ncbi:LamB/YcsF family protein [Rhizohabitans arisaemae]|uniref:LamB/YcsF family protein n=1 Tax=Rhizohabitans arisaemae TaxID=2720610 RepID=UPI0024B11C17|nr:5-oxoprolinase subunit PxpA [Rhizohabitans arisaemae]